MVRVDVCGCCPLFAIGCDADFGFLALRPNITLVILVSLMASHRSQVTSRDAKLMARNLMPMPAGWRTIKKAMMTITVWCQI